MPERVRIAYVTNGRLLAWKTLQEHSESGRFVSDILNDLESKSRLSAQERGLAVDLTSGVIRRMRTIDIILQSQMSRDRRNVEPDLWSLLQLGVYQIFFAKTPLHAAVDATVEMAKQVGQPRWTGFANGVLRSVAGLLTDEELTEPAAAAVPIFDGVFRKLQTEVFANPTTDPRDYFGEAFSLPRSLARRWSQRMSRQELQKVGFHSLSVPVNVLRVNRLKSSVAEVQAALAEEDVATSPGQHDWSLRLPSGCRMTDLPGYNEGWWSVQDESAMHAAELVNPVAGERILDLCAAPGGKTTQLAELAGDAAAIIACDVSEHRLRRIDDSLHRLGLNSVDSMLIERDGSNIPAGPYDAVLVDVPCSNTGVLSRRPEARWRFREADLLELVQLQTKLLMTAVDLVRPGGRVVYSTCSIETEETTQLISDVVAAAPAISLEKQQTQLPGMPGDGAYQALLRRI